MISLSEILISRPLTLSDIDGEQQPAPQPFPPHTRPGVRPLTFQIGQKSITAWRLTDRGHSFWHRNSIPIFDDGYFIFRMLRQLAAADRDLTLAKIYLALDHRFGTSGKIMDPWKQSFTFPLLLRIEAIGRPVNYVLNIANVRSSVEFSFRRQCLGMEHLDRSVIQKPFGREFSRDEMNECAGYLLEYLSLILLKYLWNYRRSFHLSVASELLLFGCYRGRFYQAQAESEEEFAALRTRAASGAILCRGREEDAP